MRSLVLLACAALPCLSAELAVRDVRVGLVTRPLPFSFTVTDAQGSRSGDDAFDASLGVDAGVRRSFSRPGDSLGLVVGGDLQLGSRGYTDGGQLIDAGAHASAGLGWALADRFMLLAEGGAGLGLSRMSLPATASRPSWNASGSFLAYDARISGLYEFKSGVLGGISAGWRVESHDLSGNGVDAKLDAAGWFIGIEMTWRWSSAPPTLE